MDFSPNTNNNCDIKAFQINLHNCMRATDLLTNYMEKKQIDIVLVQEPYLKDNKVALFPTNFHIIQSTNTPRCAIIVNPYKLQVTPLTEHNDDYSVWCDLNTNNKLIHFCSAYVSPDPNPTKNPEEILNSELNHLKPKHYIRLDSKFLRVLCD